ncbi:hypothetical protein C8A03DRAFT_37648 [Achaetomium macrosporum]|uniref:Uncharacterized protein n=1 Tax=Achaetomium macrosporum TaxID=79813 RepID=A0AAN7C3V1_9PEZI|nr:hypothetical protein C8A03DRAFT_37648 [Achaetomium macrosporum]
MADSGAAAPGQQPIPQHMTTTPSTMVARTFPPLGVVLDEPTFDLWKAKFLRTLRRHDLLKYIEKDIPEPQDEQAKLRWINDRADVQEFMESYMDNRIHKALAAAGWDPSYFDPKKTFEFIVRYFEYDNDDSLVNLHYELVTTKPRKFHSISAFQARISYLKERL